jgi:hypothetical protein
LPCIAAALCPFLLVWLSPISRIGYGAVRKGVVEGLRGIVVITHHAPSVGCLRPEDEDPELQQTVRLANAGWRVSVLNRASRRRHRPRKMDHMSSYALPQATDRV